MSVMHLDQHALSKRWQVSNATLEYWRMKGVGPVFLKLNGRVVYRLSDIEQYEQNNLRKSTSERATIASLQEAI